MYEVGTWDGLSHMSYKRLQSPLSLNNDSTHTTSYSWVADIYILRLPSLASVDSAFQLQEYISMLIIRLDFFYRVFVRQPLC